MKKICFSFLIAVILCASFCGCTNTGNVGNASPLPGSTASAALMPTTTPSDAYNNITDSGAITSPATTSPAASAPVTKSGSNG